MSNRLELHPARPHIFPRWNGPFLCGDRPGPLSSLVLDPVKRHSGVIHRWRPVDQVDFAPSIALAAIVAEAYAYLGCGCAFDYGRSPAQALRPEVLRLIALAWNGPIFDHGLPGLAAVDREFDLVLDVRPRR